MLTASINFSFGGPSLAVLTAALLIREFANASRDPNHANEEVRGAGEHYMHAAVAVRPARNGQQREQDQPHPAK